MDAADEYLRAEKATSTRRAYGSDWVIFLSYCTNRGVGSMPALAATVAAFLLASAKGGAAASTIGRRCAAIRYAHRLAGVEPPTNSELVKATLRGIRRSIGTARTQKAPATADLLRQMLDACPNTMRGKRDRALLALGFAGAFRRSELVALQVADLVEASDGYRVTIRRSKTDQEGQGAVIAIPRGSKLRPVECVQAWLAASGITDGPLFRKVGKGGSIGNAALSGGVVAAVVKARARSVGLDAATLSGHSLRSGFLISGAEHGASVFKLMEVSRHNRSTFSAATLADRIYSAIMAARHSCSAAEQSSPNLKEIPTRALLIATTLMCFAAGTIHAQSCDRLDRCSESDPIDLPSHHDHDDYLTWMHNQPASTITSYTNQDGDFCTHEGSSSTVICY